MKLKQHPLPILAFGLLFVSVASCQSAKPVAENPDTSPSSSPSQDTSSSSVYDSTTVSAPSPSSVSSSSVTSSSTVQPSSTVSTADVCGMSLVDPDSERFQLRKCQCSYNDEDVDCSSLNVSVLPKLISFPKAARNVKFSGNLIADVKEDSFYSARNVVELDLSHNHINFVSSAAFRAFKNLRELDLSHNKIWNMPLKSLQGLTQLRYLDLGYNDMVTLSPDLFAQTTSLKELILEKNPLKELEPKLFEHLPYLEVLSLESTLLKVVPDHLFYFTPHLKMLDLSDNLLNFVPTDALRVLDHLKVLEMSGNPIPAVGPESFLGLRTLVNLYLDHMPALTRVEKYAFGDLLQLQELHCSYNFMLSEFDAGAFVRRVDNSKVPLSQLFLRQNSLESLSRDLLNWNANVELQISDNPLYCDCNVEWMIDLKLKNEFQNHARCFGPSYLSDVPLSQLKDHKLSCGLDLSEIVVIAIAIVIAIIIIVLVIAFLVWRRSFSGYTRPYFKVRRKKNMEDIDYSI